MAIIVDPDLLDRNEVIFGTTTQTISLYPVGATAAAGSSVHLGNTTVSTRNFTTEEAQAFANSSVGDILLIKSGDDAGHFTIAAVVTNANVTTSATDPVFLATNFGLAFETRANTGGAIADGVTEQCVYSFSKEEWRSDTQNNNGGANITGNVVSASAVISNIAQDGNTAIGTTGLFVGQKVTGTDIPANTWIANVDSISNVTLNNTATGTEAIQTLVFSIDADDLIRHPFPFEPITAEQFEIGGGNAHEDWDWFSDFTIKKVRTGGWAAVAANSVTQTEYTGIVTLGSLDADAQVYYQQNSAVTTPVDFTFVGPVNEALFVWTTGDDRRTYLKLFARKKARSYAQAQISDIGVTSIQTIVNRFPLAHAPDAAITTPDAQILGTAITRDTTAATQGNLWTGADGTANTGEVTFGSTGSFFAGNVEPGDTLHIPAGNIAGYYTIGNVDSDTVLSIATDPEFTGWGFTETTQTFYVFTNEYIIGAANARVLTDAVLTDIDTVTGNLFSATGLFQTANVQTGDMVRLIEATDTDGVYKIANVVSETELTLNTTDNPFAGETAINYEVVRKGMYLQYKKEELTLASPGNLTFANAGPDTIVRTSGSWTTDGVTAGDTVVITASLLNDGSYTVATPGTLTMTLIATDALVAEGPLAAVANVYVPFHRTINGVVYGFNWRLYGVNGTALNCFEFVQHQLRQTSDIDWGQGTSRGDITDLLMTFASPTGTTVNMIIDDINTDDLNNVTYEDATGVDRVYPFSSSITLAFNQNLQDDTNAKYWVFFTNDDAGDNTGRDYGTKDALIIEDSDGNLVTGLVGGSPTYQFAYDYDGNVQRGAASAGNNAPITVVAIGLDTAQFVITTGSITRSKGINISLVSALERNYSNP